MRPTVLPKKTPDGHALHAVQNRIEERIQARVARSFPLQPGILMTLSCCTPGARQTTARVRTAVSIFALKACRQRRVVPTLSTGICALHQAMLNYATSCCGQCLWPHTEIPLVAGCLPGFSKILGSWRRGAQLPEGGRPDGKGREVALLSFGGCPGAREETFL